MKVSVTNGIENSGAFSKFTFARSLILFTSVVLTLVINIIFCTEFLCIEVKIVIECITLTPFQNNISFISLKHSSIFCLLHIIFQQLF